MTSIPKNPKEALIEEKIKEFAELYQPTDMVQIGQKEWSSVFLRAALNEAWNEATRTALEKVLSLLSPQEPTRPTLEQKAEKGQPKNP